MANTLNKSKDELCELYKDLRESIRHYISARLIDTDEEHPMEVNIPIEFGACGLSTLDMPTIVSMFQVPGDGRIYLQFYGDDDYIDFDDLHTEDLIQIVQDL